MLKNNDNIFKAGFYIFILLLVLTFVEYGIAVIGVSWGNNIYGNCRSQSLVRNTKLYAPSSPFC